MKYVPPLRYKYTFNVHYKNGKVLREDFYDKMKGLNWVYEQMAHVAYYDFTSELVEDTRDDTT